MNHATLATNYICTNFSLEFHHLNKYLALKYLIMTIKDKIISSIKNLPDTVTIDDILDQIMLIEKIEKGIEQSNKNQIVSDDELDKRLGKWLV